MQLITVVDSDQRITTFSDPAEAISFLISHDDKQFTVFTSVDRFSRIKEQVIDRRNEQDYAEITAYRDKKHEHSTWAEIEAINTQIDLIRARIRCRTNQLQFGGDVYRAGAA